MPRSRSQSRPAASPGDFYSQLKDIFPVSSSELSSFVGAHQANEKREELKKEKESAWPACKPVPDKE